jgi:hypothetical protein
MSVRGTQHTATHGSKLFIFLIKSSPHPTDLFRLLRIFPKLRTTLLVVSEKIALTRNRTQRKKRPTRSLMHDLPLHTHYLFRAFRLRRNTIRTTPISSLLLWCEPATLSLTKVMLGVIHRAALFLRSFPVWFYFNFSMSFDLMIHHYQHRLIRARIRS